MFIILRICWNVFHGFSKLNNDIQKAKSIIESQKIKHQWYHTVQGLHLKSTIFVHMVIKLFSLVDTDELRRVLIFLNEHQSLFL